MPDPQAQTITSFDDIPARDRRRIMRRVTVAWVIGSVWFVVALPGAALNTFAEKLGATATTFGWIAAMPAVAAILGIPAAWLIDHSGERKRIFLIATLAQRLLTAVLVLLPIWFGIDSPVALGVFMGVWFIMWALQQLGGAAWVSWMADLIPERIRGRYFARRRQWGLLSGIPAAIIAGVLLDWTRGSPFQLHVIVGIFVVICVFGVVDIAMFFKVPHVLQKPASDLSMGRRLAMPFVQKEFLLGSLYGGLSNLTWLPMSMFTMRYLSEQVKTTSLQLQLITIAVPMVSMLLVLSMLGAAVDRMGRRPLLATTVIGLIPVSVLWCFVDAETLWLGYALASAGVMLWAATEVGNFNTVLQFSRGNGSGFMAVNMLILSLFGVVGGVASGWYLDWVGKNAVVATLPLLGPVSGFESLFLLLAATRVLQLFLLPMLHEPSAAPIIHTWGFMLRDLCDSALHPITWLRRRREPMPRDEA
jgi:MFS family permease